LGGNNSIKFLKLNMKKLKLTSRIFILGIFLLGLSNQVQAEIIWQENFNNQADWEVPQGSTANSMTVAWHGESSIPPNFHSWAVQGTPYANVNNNSLIIAATNARGGTGKALTFWNDSGDNNCDSQGMWCGDKSLGISLPAGYDDIYLRFFMKFQSGWQWSHDGTESPMQKMLKIAHWHSDENKSPFSYFTGGGMAPVVFSDFSVWQYGASDVSHMLSYRYEHTYFPKQASPSFPDDARSAYISPANYAGNGADFDTLGQPGDGEWHEWVFHVKMNSAIGVEDGIAAFYFDGALIQEVTGLAFSDNGSRVNRRKWNYVQLGGNILNHYAPMEEEAEQWYAMDDICITTTQADLTNCFSAAPVTPRADVNQQNGINTTDALLTLRNSLGLTMSGTNWQASSTTGDVDCNSNTNTTDASLILRSSLGLSMGGTGWCVS
jgi:hypothetical protein